jgi:hypothetical protein
MRRSSLQRTRYDGVDKRVATVTDKGMLAESGPHGESVFLPDGAPAWRRVDDLKAAIAEKDERSAPG